MTFSIGIDFEVAYATCICRAATLSLIKSTLNVISDEDGKQSLSKNSIASRRKESL